MIKEDIKIESSDYIKRYTAKLVIKESIDLKSDDLADSDVVVKAIIIELKHAVEDKFVKKAIEHMSGGANAVFPLNPTNDERFGKKFPIRIFVTPQQPEQFGILVLHPNMFAEFLKLDDLKTMIPEDWKKKYKKAGITLGR